MSVFLFNWVTSAVELWAEIIKTMAGFLDIFCVHGQVREALEGWFKDNLIT